MTAPAVALREKPVDRDIRYLYSFSSPYPKLRRIKFVYFAHATYQEATGKKPHLETARDFVDEWGVFEQYGAGADWTLTGRNSTENVRYLLESLPPKRVMFPGLDERFHFASYEEAVHGIRVWCNDVVIAKREELTRAQRTLAEVMALPDTEVRP